MSIVADDAAYEVPLRTNESQEGHYLELLPFNGVSGALRPVEEAANSGSAGEPAYEVPLNSSGESEEQPYMEPI